MLAWIDLPRGKRLPLPDSFRELLKLCMEPASQRTDGSARHLQDLEMVRRALQGERSAVDALLDRMGCVRRFLHSKNARYGDPLRGSELEDAVQDTLLAIWSKLEDYSGRGSLEAWMYRFSYLELLARLRTLRRFPRHLDDAVGDSLTAREGPPLDPFEAERIYKALERLPAAGAEIIRLKHFEDLTFEEIGERQSIPANTAKTRYYRGMRRLRNLLSAEDPDDDRDPRTERAPAEHRS